MRASRAAGTAALAHRIAQTAWTYESVEQESMREVDLERASGAGASTGRISASDLGNFMMLVGLCAYRLPL